MKKIGTINGTKNILEKNDLYLKKKFGQNFLIDQNILESIVTKAGINKEINVIEIGPGIGSLTEHLLERANHVISYEIDKDLIPVLEENFKEYDNFTLINEDFLKANIKEDIKKYFNNNYPIYLVANLPYYITTPIIMYLLENVPEVVRYAVMVQLEVADRIVATKGGKDYNSLSIAIQYRSQVHKALNVSRNVFMPKPNVDSAVVIFDLHKDKRFVANNEEFFFALVRNSFANRRKTLINNLNNAYHLPKDELVKILESIGLDSNIRSEALSINDFINLSNIMCKKTLN